MEGLLDYSDFVEAACTEEDGTYRDYPSTYDVEHSVFYFLRKCDRPKEPLKVPNWIVEAAIDRWMQFIQWRNEFYGSWYTPAQCPYCGSSLSKPLHIDSYRIFMEVTVVLCAACGWWNTEEHLPVSQEDASTHYIARSIDRRAILKRYNPGQSDLPISTLSHHLMKDDRYLHFITPRKLEELVSDVFRETMNCEVHHLGGPNDGGVDLLLIQGEEQVVIQVKRREAPFPAEPVSSIREFLGAMVLKGIPKGLFVSTAHRFSPAAIQASRRAALTPVVEYIDLVDPVRLLAICKLYNNGQEPSWRRSFTSPDNINDHAIEGFNKFMELVMGSSEWKIDSTDRTGSHALECIKRQEYPCPSIVDLSGWAHAVEEQLIERWPEYQIQSAKLKQIAPYKRFGNGVELVWVLVFNDSTGASSEATVRFYHLFQLYDAGSISRCEVELINRIRKSR